MKKRFIMPLAVLLVLGLTSMVSARYYKIKVSYTGNYKYVKVYLNGTFKGLLQRGDYRSFFEQGGKTYRIKIKYGSHVRTRTILLNRPKSVIFRLAGGHDVSDSRGLRRLRVYYRGNCNSVRVYINGTYKGTIIRNSSQAFLLQTKRTYRVRLRCGGRSATKNVYVTSTSHSSVIFRRPLR